MRKRIWRMSEDKFDDIAPIIEFHTEKLDLIAYENEIFESYIELKSLNNVRLRGMVYSSNPYVLIENPEFDDFNVKIRFKTTHSGFRHKDVLKGEFHIVANQFTKTLPFTITYDLKYPTALDRTICDLKDFCALAKENYSEALQLFSSDKMNLVMQNESLQNRLLYRGFKSAPMLPIHLEEFLVGTAQKDRCYIEVKESKLEFFNVSENLKESIHINKNTWGYVEFYAHCDADFVTIEKGRLNSDFFLGNSLELNFYIHKERLHAGRNEAKILIEGIDIKKEVTIICSLDEKDTNKNASSLAEKKDLYELSSLYVDYRLKKMTTGDWAGKSIEILNRLIELHPKSYMYSLQKAQAFIVNKQRQDALWLISDLKRDIEDKKSTEWAYLLYLCTLIEQENNYVNKLTEEIENIFRLHPDDVRIFWFLSFLREEYLKDSKRKLNAIKQWVDGGCHSPYLYIEAYQIYMQDPFLLTSLNDFSLKILNWAAKRGQISVNLTVQFQKLLPEETAFDKRIFLLAKRIYKRYPEKDLLFSIVSYLLKNQMMGEEYFEWYALAVDKDLKLTGLFEAYMLSLSTSHGEELPSIVSMFFRYENHLPMEKKAYIYSNVIHYKDRNFHLYEQYLPQIQRFTLEQMHLGHMNEDLATCYQDIVDCGLIDEEIAKDLSKLVFTKRFVCLRNDIRQIVVIEEMFARPKVVPVIDNIAYFCVLTENYCVLLETMDGKYILDKQGYYLDDLMNVDRSLGKLNYLSNFADYYFFQEFDEYENADDIPQQKLNKIKDFLYNNEISLAYKRKKLPLISMILKEHTKEDLLVKYLVDYKEYRNLDSQTAAYIIDLLITSDDYMTAYEMLGIYDGLRVPGKSLLRLCNHMVDEIGDQAEDFIISLLAYLMRMSLFTDETIEYLCKYYVGPTKDMVELWKLSDVRGLTTKGLEERILTLMLYSEDFSCPSVDIFESYIKKKVSPMIVEAYLTYFSRRYLIFDEKLPEPLYKRLFIMYDASRSLNESIRFALLKYLCLKKPLDDREYDTLDILLRDCIAKNVYFEFFRRMDESLLIKYHFYDKNFIEYHGDKHQNLTIKYRFENEEEESERLVEMYEGIYVKQFVFFFGDTLHYCICPYDSEEILREDTISYQELVEREKQSRYGMLNQMKSDLIYKNHSDLVKDLKFYHGMDVTTKHLFHIIRSIES